MSAKFFGYISILLVCCSQLANAGIPKVLLGDWQGVFQCGDSEFNFTLGLREQEDRLSGSLHYKAINGERLGSSVTAQLLGSAESFGNTLSIEVITNDLANRVWMRMVYDEQKRRLFGKFDFHGSQFCSYAIAERIGTNNLLKEFNKVSKSLPKITQSKNLHKCDRDTNKWLSQLAQINTNYSQDAKAVALYLLQDENFKPYFGKTVFSLNDAKVSELGDQLTYGCRNQIPKNPQLRQVSGTLKGYLQGSRTNLWLEVQASDATNRWIEKIKQDMKQGRQASEVDVAWLRNHLAFFQLPALASLKTFDEELSAYRTGQAHKNQSNELDKLMRLEPNWANLLALTQVNPDRSIDLEVRRKMIDSVRTHIAKHWQSAFKNFFADQDDTLETARDKLVPLSRQPDTGSMMHYLPEGAISFINNMILERRLKLAENFAAHESKNYYQAFPEPENYVASIKRWGQIERGLKEKYQELLRDPPFYEFNAQRHAHYKSLLEKGQSALIVEINKINSPTELDAWFNQAFPWDLIDEETRALSVSLRLNRLADISPFYGAKNEEYFNAIFRGDVNKIKQFERQYLESAININLLPGVVSVYLLEYEKRRTRACLRSDAISIDVTTTRSGTETRDGMGILINQTPESTSYSRHPVNKEFTSIVPKIKLAAINPGGGYRGFIGGQIEDLHNSMRRVMDTYPCDSIQIKTLERNFIKLYEQML